MEVLNSIIDISLFIVRLSLLLLKALFRLVIPPPMKPVNGEIVLITGAASGIGRELALQYASLGATVICWDINEKENLETINEILRSRYRKCYAYTCDVSNRNQVKATALKVKKDIGDITILVNNAGIMPHRPFICYTSEEIERIMNINVMAHFWTLQAFLPTMVKNNYGHIVAVCSVAGFIGVGNLVPYCASKFAVEGMMEALHQDLQIQHNSQIKTTCVYPFLVNSGLYKLESVNIKFPKLTPILGSKQAAQYIINAQRRNVHATTIPKFLPSLIYLLRFLPAEVVTEIIRFVEGYIASDLQ